MAWSLLLAALFVGAGGAVSITVKRLWFPEWRGTLAVTTVVLVWVCWALALGQLLGAVGLLRRGALVTAALATGAALLVLARAMGTPVGALVRRPVGGPAPGTDEPTAGGWENLALTVATVVLVLLVAAIWIARTVIAVRRGINDPDSLGYHLPFMAVFAHSGYADQHRLLIPLYPVQFYPANDELLSAMALALTHSMAFAAIKNLLFGGFVLVAAHALGRAYRASRPALAATAVVLGFPVMAFSQPGEAVNDALMLLLLVGGLAALAHARDRPAPYVLALACAGAALGVKFSAIVPAAALAGLAVVLLVVRVPRHRWGWAGTGLLASAALGGSWYLRNAITYGNPVPPVHAALGPLHLRSISTVSDALAFSVAGYLVRGRYLSVFARGMVRSLGPLFVVMGPLAVFGTIAGLRSRDGFRRGLSVFAVVAAVGYISTPASAWGRPNQIPYSFVVNLHYAAPALLAALVAGAVELARWRRAWVLPVIGSVAVLTSISRGRGIAVWSTEMGGPGFYLLVAAAVAGGVVGLAWLRPSLRGWATPVAGGAALVALVGVAVIAGRYPTRRATDPVVRWAGEVQGASIGAWITNIADLYGPHAANRVVVMNRLDHGAAGALDTCQGWKQAVLDGHFQYTAVIANTAWTRWLNADPAFRVVTADRGAVVFQVVGRPDVSCPGQDNSDADFWLKPARGI